MPLVSPFRTSFGTQTARDILLVRAVDRLARTAGASASPFATRSTRPEYVDGAVDVMRRFLIPGCSSRRPADAPRASARRSSPFKGHRMAKAALEMAVLDAELRAEGRSFARELGAVRDRVPCGVSVGIMDSIPQLLDAVDGYLDEGYVRIKLKIEPGWDVEPVRAVRERFGDDVLLQVDANTAYTLARRPAPRQARRTSTCSSSSSRSRRRTCSGTPSSPADRAHADLPRRVDHLGADRGGRASAWAPAQVINIKPGRVGGYLEAAPHPRPRRRPRHRRSGAAAWSSPGLGRAANVALASLPGFTLPGDVSASDRFYQHRHHGAVRHATTATSTCRPAPGWVSTPIPEILESLTTSVEWVPL